MATREDADLLVERIVARLEPVLARLIEEATARQAERIVAEIRANLSNPLAPREDRCILLSDLLLSLFSPEEIRRLPIGEELRNQLPGMGTPANIAYELAMGLERRNQVDARFFASLLQQRPLRAVDILRVQTFWDART